MHFSIGGPTDTWAAGSSAQDVNKAYTATNSVTNSQIKVVIARYKCQSIYLYDLLLRSSSCIVASSGVTSSAARYVCVLILREYLWMHSHINMCECNPRHIVLYDAHLDTSSIPNSPPAPQSSHDPMPLQPHSTLLYCKHCENTRKQSIVLQIFPSRNSENGYACHHSTPKIAHHSI
jgi:hypothetical protein